MTVTTARKTKTELKRSDFDTIQEFFEYFDSRHPIVFTFLEWSFTDWFETQGNTKGSVEYFWQKLRWETKLSGLDSCLTSRYSRKLTQVHPEWVGKIEQSALKTP